MELEPIWATLLEKALAGKNVKELLLNVGAGGGAPAAGSAAPAAGGAAAAEAPKEEEKKEEEKEESDDDMVRFLACVSIGQYLIFWVCRASDCSINCFAIVYMSSCIHLTHIARKLSKHSFTFDWLRAMTEPQKSSNSDAEYFP